MRSTKWNSSSPVHHTYILCIFPKVLFTAVYSALAFNNIKHIFQSATVQREVKNKHHMTAIRSVPCITILLSRASRSHRVHIFWGLHNFYLAIVHKLALGSHLSSTCGKKIRFFGGFRIHSKHQVNVMRWRNWNSLSPVHHAHILCIFSSVLYIQQPNFIP